MFAALGDETRLALVVKLSSGRPASIVELTADSALSRQAITKHLRVLERAGIVRSSREGRESRFAFDARAIIEARSYLDSVSAQWDRTLSRLKSFVER